jgi:hypothetical protein
MRYRNLLLFSLLCASVFGLTRGSASAQELVSARILSSEGAVEIHRMAQGQAQLTRIDYHVNDELLAGDVIKTRAGGRLVVGIPDGSQAIIGENTIVEIKDFSHSPRTIFNVLRGRTRVRIEKSGGRPNPYRVNTPTAVIAVRGTLFDVIVKGNETQVFVHEGEVAVSNTLTPDQIIVLLPNQKTRVRGGQLPEAPAPFKPGQNNDIFNSPDNKRLQAGLPNEAHRRDGGDGMPGQGDNGRGGNMPGQNPGNSPGHPGSGKKPEIE